MENWKHKEQEGLNGSVFCTLCGLETGISLDWT